MVDSDPSTGLSMMTADTEFGELAIPTPIQPRDLAEIVSLESSGKINHVSAKKVFDVLWADRMKMISETLIKLIKQND